MSAKLRIFIGYLVLFLLLGITVTQSQILKDTASLNILKSGVDDIYNLRFDKAHDVVQKLNQSFPDHPVVYLLRGMITYWENYPLIPSSPARISYDNDMRTCMRLCEASSDSDDYPEYLLGNLGARGMLLMFYADNNLSDNVFPLAKSTYRYLRQCFDYSLVYHDFYFFTGLYNYYREAYPDAHRIYKVLAFLFPKGDRNRGLAELQKAATNAIMLKAESYYFLSNIYVTYENNYEEAYVYSKALHELYPANPEYLADHLRNLLLAAKYDEAESLIRSPACELDNAFFRAQLTILNGILQEKKYKDYPEAKKYYEKGLRDISVFDSYGNDYAAFACFGLSRICDINRDKQCKKAYRKRALDLTDFKALNFDD